MGAIITGILSFSGLAPFSPPISVYIFTLLTGSGSLPARVRSFLNARSETWGRGRAPP